MNCRDVARCWWPTCLEPARRAATSVRDHAPGRVPWPFPTIDRVVTAITEGAGEVVYKHTHEITAGRTGSQESKGETAMKTFNTKTFATAAALAAAATFALPSTQAEARVNGWAIGAGIVGAGIIAGSIAAAHAQPVYVVPATRCRFVDRFDRFGNYAGTVKVCRSRY